MQKKTQSLSLTARILISAGFLVTMAGHALAQTGEMVSLRSDGSLPASIGVTDYMPAVTPDGRFVAFMADATNLVSPNASGYQIYLRDRVLGSTELISADNAGNAGNSSSSVSPSISADGCKVVFSSFSSNLVPGDSNGREDVFVRDRCSTPPQTSAVSVSAGGTLGNGASAEARISANGRYVVFSSYTSNLVPPYGDSTSNTLYVRDLQLSTTSVLGIDPSNSLRAITGNEPDISADGMRVVFFAYGRPESPAMWQIYGFDRSTATLFMVSTDAAGVPQNQGGEGTSTVAKPAISGDGLWAAFASRSTNLAPGVTDGNRHVYVKDFTTGAIHVADVASDGTLGNNNSSGSGAGERPSISYDSTWVTFSTNSTNLFANAPFQSVILRNIHTGETTGLTVNSTSALPAISSDVNGRFVSFYSPSHLDSRFQARGYFLLDRVGNPVNFSTRYRLYSDGTKEHLYTTDLNEYNVLSTGGGWLAEGAIYKIFQGAGFWSGVDAVPYYRLYNSSSYQHHWTTDLNEYTVLATMGWTQEGIDGYILPSAVAGTLPLYRLYLNALGGLHLWTTDANERNVLTTTAGWVDEGVAGYVVPLP